jgi:hypothetical protein
MLRMQAKEEVKLWRGYIAAVDAGEVVSIGNDGLGAALRGVVLLQVSLLT